LVPESVQLTARSSVVELVLHWEPQSAVVSVTLSERSTAIQLEAVSARSKAAVLVHQSVH
jgi:hypothetical protein